MQINLERTALENIAALATDSIFFTPTLPDDIAAGKPLPYDPNATVAIGAVYGRGLNVDGANSNTQVILYVRPTIDDVAEDGASQKIMYQRVTLASVAGVNATVTLSSEMTEEEASSSVAQQLGLIASEFTFVVYTEGAGVLQIQAVQDSLLYLPGMVTLTVQSGD